MIKRMVQQMTYEEVKNRITDLVSNPDTATENAVGLLSDLEADYTNLDSMTAKQAENEARIRELQDTNQKLFLSVTGNPEQAEEEEEKQPGIDWDNLFKEDSNDGK